ncbi:MAG: hypothetical protein KAK00_07795 [Nanoarchaeota archaeon]|nr:hypothetical protein [Nanoarchaeota archaeon]
MEKGILITLGLIIGYILFRFITKKPKRLTNMSELQSNSEHTQKTKNAEHFSVSTIPDILTDDKYKVKGQWGR